MVRQLLGISVLGLALCTSSCADPAPQQITTTSWHGLSGLYVIPTARMIGNRNFCVGFNESKHTEFVAGEKYTDRQIRGVVTYGVSPRVEVTATYYNNMY